MPQAALGYTPARDQLGLNEPLTMEEKMEQQALLAQTTGKPPQYAYRPPETTPEPEVATVEPESTEVGLFGEVIGSLRSQGEAFLSGYGHVLKDTTDYDNLGDALVAAGEVVGPSDEFDEQKRREAEARDAAVASGEMSETERLGRETGEAITQGVTSFGTIAAAGAAGSAVGAAIGAPLGGIGAIPGGLIGGVIGAGIAGFSLAFPQMYEGNRQTAIENGEDVEDPAVQQRLLVVSGGLAALDSYAPLKGLSRLGKVGKEVAEKLATRSLGRAALSGAGKDAIAEGLTEVTQMAVSEVAFNPELRKAMTEEDVKEWAPRVLQQHGKEAYLNFIGGFGAGGLAGGSTSAWQQKGVNAARKHDVETLQALADEHGVSVEKLEAMAADPKQASALALGAKDIVAKRQNLTNKQALSDATPDDEDTTRYAAEAETAYDKARDGFMTKLGGKTVGQLKADREAADKQRHHDLTTKAKDAGFTPADTVATDEIGRHVTAFDEARASRQEAQAKVARSVKPSKRLKADAQLKEAIDAEADARENMHRHVEGKSPEQARQEVQDWRRGSEAEARRRPAIAHERARHFNPDDTPEAQANRALDLMDRYHPSKDHGSKGLRESLTKAKRKLEQTRGSGGASVDEIVAAEQRVADLTSRLGQSSPIYAAAEEVLGELPEEVVASTREQRAKGLEEEAATSEVETPEPPIEAAAEAKAKPKPKPAPGVAVTEKALAKADTPPLPEEHERYFTRDAQTVDVPVEALKPKRARSGGIERAGKLMAQAYRGEVAPRAAISVRAEPGGTYTVLDGNSTYANAVKAGWKSMPVRVMTDEQFHEENAPKLVKGIKKDTGVTIRTTHSEGRIKAYVSGNAIARGATIKAIRARAEKEGLNVDIAASSERAPTRAPERRPTREEPPIEAAAGVDDAFLPPPDKTKVDGQLNLWRQAAIAAHPNTAAMLRAAPRADRALRAGNEAVAEDLGTPYSHGPIKKAVRIDEKAQEDVDLSKGETVGKLTDVVRGTFQPTTAAEADRVVQGIKQRFGPENVLDRGWKRLPTGYADRKVMILLPNDMIGEVQLVAPPMYDAKENLGGHDLYGQIRTPGIDPELKQRLVDQSLALYAAADAKTDGSLLRAPGYALSTSSGVSVTNPNGVSPLSSPLNQIDLSTSTQPEASQGQSQTGASVVVPPATNNVAASSMNVGSNEQTPSVIRNVGDIPPDSNRRTGGRLGQYHRYRDEIDRLQSAVLTPEQADAAVDAWGVDGKEHSIVVGPSGEVLSAGTNDHGNEVTYSHHVNQQRFVPGAGLIFTHNHPLESASSLGDTILLVASPGFAEMRVVGPRGFLQVIKRAPSAEVLGSNPYKELVETMQPVHDRGRDRYMDHGIDPKTAVAIHSRGIMQAMADVDIIDVDTINDPVVFSPEEQRLMQEVRADARQAFRSSLRERLRPALPGAGEGEVEGAERPGGVGPEGRGPAGAEAVPDDAVDTAKGIDIEGIARRAGISAKDRLASTLSMLYGRDGPPQKMKTNWEAATWLQNRTSAAVGAHTDFKADLPPEAQERIARTMVAEVMAALEARGEGSAADWYTKAIEDALDIAAEIWPSLRSDEAAAAAGFGDAANARFALTYALATSSQNLDVSANTKVGSKAFDALTKNIAAGRYAFPTKLGSGDKQKAMNENFAKFGPLFKAMPGATPAEKLTAMRTLFAAKKPLTEWNDIFKRLGVKASDMGQTHKDTEVYGSSMLGPKIGNGFYQNLNGNYDPVTIDLWMRRTWGRLTGKSIGKESSLPDQINRLRRAVSTSFRNAGNNDALLAAEAERQRLVDQKRSAAVMIWQTKKERDEYEKDLQRQIKAYDDMIPSLKNLKVSEGWDEAYATDNAALFAYAKRLNADWNKHYKSLQYPDGEFVKNDDGTFAKDAKGKKIKIKALEVPGEVKPTWAKAAKMITAAQTTPIDQVANGTQRKQIEAAIARARSILAANGIHITNADMQAILWYPEKDLWAALSSEPQVEIDPETGEETPLPISPLNESYDTAFRREVEERKNGQQAETGDGRRGAGSAGADAGAAAQGRAAGAGVRGARKNRGGAGSGAESAKGVDLSLGLDTQGESWLGEKGIGSLKPAQARALVRQLAQTAGVKANDLTPGPGGWFNPDTQQIEMEPSSVTELPGDPDPAAVRRLASMLGEGAGQYSVLTVNDKPAPGADTAYRVMVTSSVSPERLFELAREADPNFTGVAPKPGGAAFVIPDHSPLSEGALERLGELISAEAPEDAFSITHARVAHEFVEGGTKGEGYHSSHGSTPKGRDDLALSRRVAEEILSAQGVYASRDVSDGSEVAAWAKEQGFTGTLRPELMHITTAYSRAPAELTPNAKPLTVTFKNAKPIQLQNGLVLPITSPELQADWKRHMDAGATWDHGPEYTPHVSFKYNPTAEDVERLKTAAPFSGTLTLTPEQSQPLVPGQSFAAANEDVEVAPDAPEGEVLAASGTDFEFTDPPKKSVKAYKLFKTDPEGNLYPLFVNANTPVPTGQWLKAEPGPAHPKGGVKSKIGKLAFRPGWHAGDLPVATHIGSMSTPGLTAPDTRPADQVWAEVEMGDDVDWQTEANKRATTSKAGVPIARTAHITDQVPAGGHYRYKTNPNMTGNWLIGGELKVNRILPDEEVQSVNEAAGVADLPRAVESAKGTDVTFPAYMAKPGTPGREALQTMRNAAADPRRALTSWATRLETHVVNQFAPIRQLEMNLKGKLGIGMDSAFKAAEMAINDAGRAETLMFYGAGGLDTNGAFRNAPGTIGIKAMLDKLGSGQSIVDWQHYMAARRAKDLHARGFKTPLTDSDIVDGLSKKSALFDEVAADWKRFNDANIDLLVKTGRIKQAQADAMKADALYIPFYRSDERVDGAPELFDEFGIRDALRIGNASGSRTLANRDPGIHKMVGGDVLKLDNLVENMIRNSHAMAAAAMRNDAANKTFDLMEQAGMMTTVRGRQKNKRGEFVRVEKPHPSAIKMWRNGKEFWAMPVDPAAEPLFIALAGFKPQQLTGIHGFMATVGSAFRTSITMSPAFMVRNMIRGMVSTGVLTSGANLTLKNNVFTGMRDSLRRGASRQMFTSISGMGDFNFGSPDSGLGKNDWMVEYGLAKPTYGTRWRKILSKMEEIGTATELGDRLAAMETMRKNGVRDDEAAYHALTIVNYSRKGSSATLRALLPLVPFLNARIQGLARLGGGAVGRSGALGRKQAIAQLALHGAILTFLSSALWMWNNDDEERREKYEAEPLHRRLNYHIIYVGDSKILIPKAFEIGAIFSSIPEMFLEAAVQGQTEELGSASRQTLLNTFGFNPIPAAALPAVEMVANHSFFTGQPIVGQRFEGLMRRERVDKSTSAIAKVLADTWLGDWTGLSPIMVQHLLEGYGGLPFSSLSSATDVVAGDLGLVPSKPEGAFGSVPIASKVAENIFGSMFKRADADASNRYVGEFYDMKSTITQVYRSAKDAAQNRDADRYREILDQVPGGAEGLVAANRLVNRASSRLTELNRAIREVERNSKLDPAEKRAKMDPLVTARNRLTEQVHRTVRAFEERYGESFASAA